MGKQASRSVCRVPAILYVREFQGNVSLVEHGWGRDDGSTPTYVRCVNLIGLGLRPLPVGDTM